MDRYTHKTAIIGCLQGGRGCVFFMLVFSLCPNGSVPLLVLLLACGLGVSHPGVLLALLSFSLPLLIYLDCAVGLSLV